jgi:sulfite reductase (NADPH) flavoprotein alpha-component
MVGPGVGIAPFRSFLQEREALRKEGKSVGENWLFFGEQYRALNFYYEDELEHWRTSGNLLHLDLAFSRDQEHKIYVQDRMQERAKRFGSGWIVALIFTCAAMLPIWLRTWRAHCWISSADGVLSMLHWTF